MVDDMAVIGAGATAVSLLSCLRDEIGMAGLPMVSISLWGKPDSFGIGNAFGAARRGHGVNTPAAMLGLSDSDPAGFLRWLANRGREHNVYPERKVMAQFLQESYAGLCRSPELGLDEFRDEAIDLCPNPDGSFRVIGKGGASASARCVVLCVGAAPRRGLAHLSNFPGYCGPEAAMGRVAGAAVLIAGTGPSGLDALHSAMLGGAREIHMFSRHGLLPTCQSPAPHYQPRHLTWPRLREQSRGRSIGLLRALALLRREIQEIGSRCEYQTALMALRREGPDAFLGDLLDRARAEDLPMQDLLMSTRPYMHRLWRAWPLADQIRFDREWRARWSAWRHPVPVEIYAQLRDAMRAGVVHVHRLDQPPAAQDGAFLIRTTAGRTVRGSVLVDATGWSAGVDSMPLLRALHGRGWVEAHPCGGIHVDSVRMECMVGSGRVRNLFAIGPIASGVLFSTNAHWFNARCAAQWARQWVAAAGQAGGVVVEPLHR